MVNAAAVEVALGWLVGAVVRTLLFQSLWKVLPSKASLDSTEQLAGESPTLGHLVGYLPSKDWLILFG